MIVPCQRAEIDWATMPSGLSREQGPGAAAVAQRLRLLDLDRPDTVVLADVLQQSVVAPNVDAIVVRFCELLGRIETFNRIVSKHSHLERLQNTLKRYVSTLGVDIENPEYFAERLRIGQVHQKLGVTQGHYQCAIRHLQDLLIDYIPATIREDDTAFDKLLRFILKVTALDMSLAVESYCDARVSGLRKSLRSERGEAERLRKLSITDWLTQLDNHSYSRSCLSAALDLAKREQRPLCVIMADLDHFKRINDTHGHLIGDEVLRIAAARMVSGARAGDRIARYGGEEFLFILQDTDLAEGEEVAERVRARITDDTVRCGDVKLTVTLSLGLALARASDSVDALIERADEALYAAKKAGRDCVRVEEGLTAPLSANGP